MSTEVMTLQEFAEDLQELADEWGDDAPAVLVGDVHGNLDVGEKDGYTQHGSVAFANSIFSSNGVFELGQKADRRFYGTMLIRRENLTEEAQDHLSSNGGGA